jgi:hypothetical protein
MFQSTLIVDVFFFFKNLMYRKVWLISPWFSDLKFLAKSLKILFKSGLNPITIVIYPGFNDLEIWFGSGANKLDFTVNVCKFRVRLDIKFM